MQERTALILKEQDLKQVELSRVAGVTKGLVGQWLNGPAKGMSYKPASRLNAKYGYSIEWLMSGRDPKMAPVNGLRQVTVDYDEITPEAREVAQLWTELSPTVASWIRDLIFMARLAERRYPWLRRGRPKGETYAAWERRMEQNFHAVTVAEIKRHRSAQS